VIENVFHFSQLLVTQTARLNSPGLALSGPFLQSSATGGGFIKPGPCNSHTGLMNQTPTIG
jgi:hypothetical protein